MSLPFDMIRTLMIRTIKVQRQEQAGALESAVAVLNSSIAHNDESARRIRADLQQQEGREGSLAAQIDQRRARLSEIEGQLTAGAQAIRAQQEKAEENARSAGQLEQELEWSGPLGTAAPTISLLLDHGHIGAIIPYLAGPGRRRCRR